MVLRQTFPPTVFSISRGCSCPSAFKVGTKESVAIYSPQRIMRQFIFGQRDVWIVGGNMALEHKGC